MRILLTVLSTSFLATAALAQQQPTVTPPVSPEGTAQAKAAIAECERLISYLEGTRPAAAGVTVEQAAAWRQGNDFEACRSTLQRLTQTNQAGTPGTTAGSSGLPASSTAAPQSAPPPAQANSVPPLRPRAQPQAQAQPGAAAPVGTSAAQVMVNQPQPSVTVRQRQPEIIVRQAPPIITVQQPQPEIIVRMPEPDVNVSVAQPEVQVNMAQPVVQVVPPQVRSDGRQPNVRFERTGEPRIVYQPAEGQPQVRYESAGGPGSQQNPAGAEPRPTSPGGVSPQAAQAQLNAGQPGYATASLPPARTEPAQTGALPQAPGQAVAVSQLEDMEVYGGGGEKLGDVQKVVTGTDNVTYVLINHGGFLGLGTRQVAIPSDRIALQGNRLVAENLTEEQLQAFPDFKDTANFKELEGEETASIRAHR